MADKKTASPRKQKFIVKMERDAQKAFLEEIFNDIYAHRLRIYTVNFFRGIAFSVGGIIGATLVIALILWVLSLFGNIPVIGEYFKETQKTIQNTTN